MTSPGWPPSNPVLLDAAARSIPVWGEVELAWRLRGDNPVPWLAVTGTNGKTTTVQMLAEILRADGLNAIAVGNVGTPVLEAVMNPEPFDVLAVELSSYQLHWSSSISAEASVVLNVAPDHLDWHGDLESYTADKGRIYQQRPARLRLQRRGSDDRATRRGGRRRRGMPGDRVHPRTARLPGMVGLVDDVLADRAFVIGRISSAVELGTLADLASPSGVPAAPHTVANALAAAALARAHGVAPRAVRDGLRAFVPDAHRVADLGEVNGVRYVDDSKATNPHAASASLRSFDHNVWIAGGLAKGAGFDELVEEAKDQLRAVVLIGTDRAIIADALRRHAPDVPVVEVETGDTDLMDRVVEVAASLAHEGDTVLLAPGCASWDQFRNYSARGDAFASAVERLRNQS